MSSEEEEFQGDESSEEEFQADEESEEEEVLEADEESDDDDEVPLASLKKTKAKSIPEDDDEDESSDDDIPLAALKSPSPKKKKPAAKKKTAPKKKATKAKAKKPTKKKKDAAPVASNGSFRSASAALYGTKCQKGLLIQNLLCRWWYAIAWPENIPEDPPKHYDSLDGMPGVFVCTSGGDVGRINDMRDMSKCPNFKNFSKMPSSELKDLLIKALKGQKEALIQAEGPGTETENDINRMLKWAEKLNPDKADKEAIQVLKSLNAS